ncbi:hypothetical protein ACFVWY_08855 [Streptomyces sp. NPDC058195]|uniref:hypothetical protein n=1 Tax=Streptomyces sp. NPDC058195 TaxID=3346375 RepID=UPI0036EAA656
MALRCIRSFSAYDGGVPRVVRAGQLLDDNDPIVTGRESAFESVDDHLAARRPQVEQATAEPGEPRSLSLVDDGTPKRRPRGSRSTK